MKKITRPVKKLDRSGQYSLFTEELCAAKTNRKEANETSRIFINPDVTSLYIGTTPLRTYLQTMKIREPFIIRKLLNRQDWQSFEDTYAASGRAPYAPQLMVGLVLYGILQGKTSLRELEQLARTDVGCMWVTGGIYPDHSIIGRFIQQHGERLAGEFFIALTQHVLKKTGSHTRQVAGDGTLVESAASAYRLLKQEAVEREAVKKRSKANDKPNNRRLAKRAEQAEKAHECLEERIAKRKSQGKSAKHLVISRTDPEAVVQPVKKTKASLPSFKPSVLANEKRVITGFAVDPSSETKVLDDMLTMTESVGGESVETLLLDAGYHTNGVINAAIERDINLLCPEGSFDKSQSLLKQSEKKFPKSSFAYDERTDSYRCPQGEQLQPRNRYQGSDKYPAYVVYGTKACEDCPLKSRCTKSPKGRKIKRYAGDEAKEALRQVMSQPKAQVVYRKRLWMVEPVFSVLKGKQQLNRFRRRGLANVRIEFALHVLAYNISRLLAYIGLYFVYIFYRNCQYAI